jgi:hypothetical protein
MLIDTVRDQLKQLRMPVASAELETIIQKRKKNTDVQWVSELLSAELNARKDNAVEKRIRKAGFSVKRLCSIIRRARERNTLDIVFKQILSSKLWILDDWGVVSMPRDVSEEIFDLFDRRKHNSAMLLTSNRDVSEWQEVFSDPVLASAAIDRMFEDAHVCVFEGPSHRMKGRITFKEIDKEKNEN